MISSRLAYIWGTDLFPDNWIYVHEPAVKVGRIQNYSNWSPEFMMFATLGSVEKIEIRQRFYGAFTN